MFDSDSSIVWRLRSLSRCERNRDFSTTGQLSKLVKDDDLRLALAVSRQARMISSAGSARSPSARKPESPPQNLEGRLAVLMHLRAIQLKSALWGVEVVAIS